MIPTIRWQQPRHDEAWSPFQRGSNERPLRITFHTSSLHEISHDEVFALDMLRGLANLPEVEAIETQAGHASYFSIGELDERGDQLLVQIHREDGRVGLTSVWPASRLPADAAALIGQSQIFPTHPDVQPVLPELITAYAHRQIKGDILVGHLPLLPPMSER